VSAFADFESISENAAFVCASRNEELRSDVLNERTRIIREFSFENSKLKAPRYFSGAFNLP